MRIFEAMRRLVRNTDRLNAVVEGIDNESRILNDKFEAIIQGIDNQSRMLNDKLDQFLRLAADQSRIVSEGLSAVSQGIHNQARDMNERFQLMTMTIGHLENAVTELQKAQLVMMRDQVEAIDGLALAMEPTAVAAKG